MIGPNVARGCSMYNSMHTATSQLTDRSCIHTPNLGRNLLQIRFSLDTTASRQSRSVHRRAGKAMMPYFHRPTMQASALIDICRHCCDTVSSFRRRSTWSTLFRAATASIAPGLYIPCWRNGTVLPPASLTRAASPC